MLYASFFMLQVQLYVFSFCLFSFVYLFVSLKEIDFHKDQNIYKNKRKHLFIYYETVVKRIICSWKRKIEKYLTDM